MRDRGLARHPGPFGSSGQGCQASVAHEMRSYRKAGGRCPPSRERRVAQAALRVAAWNCSSSVEPCRADSDDWPAAITSLSLSK